MSQAKKKILIVDDEVDLVEILSEILEDYEIFKAFDGQQGLQQLREKLPDLVVSDVMMPKLNGLEMLRTLRAEGFKTPVIYITGFADTEKIREAWQLGATDFLDKPVKPERLVSLIQKVFERAPDQVVIPQSLVDQIASEAKLAGVSIEEWVKTRLKF
jgi:DNA-binding NtrC family response regulator